MELEVFVQTRYRCPICRRSYSRRGTAVNHQAQCWLDPENKACRTCAHFNPRACFAETCSSDGEPLDSFTGKWVIGCPSWEAA